MLLDLSKLEVLSQIKCSRQTEDRLMATQRGELLS